MNEKKPSLLRAADRSPADDTSFTHPLNPRSKVYMRSLGDATGLTRVGVHLMRVPPGKESFIYHKHYAEEEFIYILSGRGSAEIEGETFEVGPGDFLGFAAAVGHHLKNPFEEDLVYLAGGERREAEVADFPTLGKRIVRVGMNISIHPIESAEPFPGFPALGEKPPAYDPIARVLKKESD